MGTREEEFLKRLKATFRIEAEEHLQAMSTGLVALESLSGEAQTEVVETVFREAHSLKGAARAVDSDDVEAVCQAMESVLSACKRQEISASPQTLDTMHEALELLGLLLSTPDEQQGPLLKRIPVSIEALNRVLDAGAETPAAPVEERRGQEPVAEDPPMEEPSASFTTEVSKANDVPQPITPLSHSLKVKEKRVVESSPVIKLPANVTASVVGTTTEKPVSAQQSGIVAPGKEPVVQHTETVRIAASKLDSLMRQTEELLAIKLTLAQRAVELREIQEFVNEYSRSVTKAQRESRSRRPRERREDASSSLAEFSEQSRLATRTLDTKLNTLRRAAEHDRRLVGGMIDNLMEDIKKVLMLPVASLLDVLPKMVRDLARSQSKEVHLEIHGGDIEVDRRILEDMKDPLVHLLRNSVDHGLEGPAERERNGKSRQGTIAIHVAPRDSSNVEIIIADDGRGIDIAHVKSAAVRLSHITEEQAAELPDPEAIMLIFQSELSTSPIITDLSGRGLGMAIVREKVEKLGGRIAVETECGAGTLFRITLPLTLATFRGVLVTAGGSPFIIPTASIERVVRIAPHEVRSVCGRRTIVIDDQTVSLVHLSTVLELPPVKDTDSSVFTAVVLGALDKRIAFVVERVLDEQEVLVKNLGKQLARVRNITAATVLGSGKIVPILNVHDLLKSALLASAQRATAMDVVNDTKSGQQSILIAEDSITSRMLIKNILESAGYRVKTTVDGAEALAALQAEPFDLVVSDVEMPHLNGFELTAKIRSDSLLAETPVVLVTSLGSREHQERGVEAGANAYIIKSNFDQTNLLEVVRRLI